MVAWFLASVDAEVEKSGTDVVAPKPPYPRTLPFHETIDWFAHATPYLLLLLPTPASDGFVHLAWSTLALVAKPCASVPTTPCWFVLSLGLLLWLRVLTFFFFCDVGGSMRIADIYGRASGCI